MPRPLSTSEARSPCPLMVTPGTAAASREGVPGRAAAAGTAFGHGAVPAGPEIGAARFPGAERAANPRLARPLAVRDIVDDDRPPARVAFQQCVACVNHGRRHPAGTSIYDSSSAPTDAQP